MEFPGRCSSNLTPPCSGRVEVKRPELTGEGGSGHAFPTRPAPRGPQSLRVDAGAGPGFPFPGAFQPPSFGVSFPSVSPPRSRLCVFPLVQAPHVLSGLRGRDAGPGRAHGCPSRLSPGDLPPCRPLPGGREVSLASRPGTSGTEEVGAQSWVLREGTGDGEGGRGKVSAGMSLPGPRSSRPGLHAALRPFPKTSGVGTLQTRRR